MDQTFDIWATYALQDISNNPISKKIQQRFALQPLQCVCGVKKSNIIKNLRSLEIKKKKNRLRIRFLSCLIKLEERNPRSRRLLEVRTYYIVYVLTSEETSQAVFRLQKGHRPPLTMI